MHARSRVVVVEDSPAGIRAGKAAGCQVLAVATTHSTARIKDAGADWIIQDLRSTTLVEPAGSETAQVQLEIRNALES